MEHQPFQRGEVAPAFPDWPATVLLVEFVRTHDERIFCEFVKRHEQMVLSVCRRVLHHWQDAEDAAQKTWLVVWRKAASYQEGACLNSWLYGIAHRVARNVGRSNRRRGDHEHFYGLLAQLAQPFDEAAFHEEQALILTEIQRLPEKIRNPFVLRWLEGKSRSKVAKELGLPKGTVASRVRKARELLRRRLVCTTVELFSREP